MMQTPYLTVPLTRARIPSIGLGTFGSDRVEPDAIARAVKIAVKAGYRHIDCASVYGNERQIGEALASLFADGTVKREDLWITGKLWNDKHAPDDARASFFQSLEDLRLDYFDLYLIHWPFPNYHPPKCSVDSRSPDARPYSHERFMDAWRALESLVDEGFARHIGTSNTTVPKLTLLLRDARIRPACSEMELHPHFRQPALVAFCKNHGIVPIGYSPLGSPGRPDRDRTSGDTVDMEDPVILSIAKAHNVHPAAVCLKWAAANGHIPIPFSVSERNIVSNLEAVCTDHLTADEKRAIDAIDRNCRLIKGQVFLWEGAKDWHDLWDEDGIIPT